MNGDPRHLLNPEQVHWLDFPLWIPGLQEERSREERGRSWGDRPPCPPPGVALPGDPASGSQLPCLPTLLPHEEDWQGLLPGVGGRVATAVLLPCFQLSLRNKGR